MHAIACPALWVHMNARNLFVNAFALFSACMLGLAAGAIWMVATLYLRQPLPWLALPIGALLAWAIRLGVRPPGPGTALLAALATVLASIYVSVLIAAANIAGDLGMGLIDALRTSGAGMLWQLAHLALTPVDIGWFIAGAVLAATLALRRRSPPP
jgi:vitamin B12 transport system permease protein